MKLAMQPAMSTKPVLPKPASRAITATTANASMKTALRLMRRRS